MATPYPPHGTDPWDDPLLDYIDSSDDDHLSAAQAAVLAHINDPSGAHDAVAISFNPSPGVAATNVQAAIIEVMTAGAYRPEQFGAVGDGVANDLPAIQAMYDHIQTTGKPALVVFTQGKTYNCASITNPIGPALFPHSDNTVTLAYGATLIAPATTGGWGGFIIYMDRNGTRNRPVVNVQWHGGKIVTKDDLDNGFSVGPVTNGIFTDIEIDMMTYQGHRGFCVQPGIGGGADTGPASNILVSNILVRGGENAFDLETNGVGYLSNVRFDNCRAIGGATGWANADLVGFRFSGGGVVGAVSNCHLSNIEVVGYQQGLTLGSMDNCTISELTLTNQRPGALAVFGLLGSAQDIVDVDIRGVTIVTETANTAQAVRVRLTDGVTISDLDIRGPFATALHNSGNDSTITDVVIDGATLGVDIPAGSFRSAFRNFTFIGVATMRNNSHPDDIYRGWVNRGAGGALTDLTGGSTGIPMFGYNSHTNWNTYAAGNLQSSGAQNATVSYSFECPAGTYALRLIHSQSTNRGIYTIAIDGVTVGTIDGYNAATQTIMSEITGIALYGGNHTVTLTMATKNASSSSYFGVVNQLALGKTA